MMKFKYRKIFSKDANGYFVQMAVDKNWVTLKLFNEYRDADDYIERLKEKNKIYGK